ncbi:hypothetical protein BC830DRAFT_1116233 [Chytriomyces sp. MP71]|nr:hypothetical protein BC830DRAFT_1116233 [Chytriomyces sp. MP71]
MRHARRSTLTPDDVNHALKARSMQPVYGYSSQAPTRFKSTLAATVQAAASQRLYYVEDPEIDLDTLINAPLPPVPLHVTFTAHWLAIEGVQPAIVQNPTPADIKAASSDASTAEASAQQHQQQQSVLISTANPDQATVNGEVLVKTVLSKELQLYHDKITEAILSLNHSTVALAVDSLQTDPGIQPLLPYFVQFMTQKITKHVRNLKILWNMMRMTRGLLNNKNLFIEPYLHQLMPNIITCIVSKRISENPLEDHHALRRFSADLVAYACTTYTPTYPTLQPRVTKTLLRAFLDPSKPNATHYGAVVGLARLGNEVVRLLLRPNVKAFAAECLCANGAAGEAEARDRDMCKDAIVAMLVGHVVEEWRHSEGGARARGEEVRGPEREGLEQEMVDMFGELVGGEVARVVYEILTGASGAFNVVGTVNIGEGRLAGFEMDLDL